MQYICSNGGKNLLEFINSYFNITTRIIWIPFGFYEESGIEVFIFINSCETIFKSYVSAHSIVCYRQGLFSGRIILIQNLSPTPSSDPIPVGGVRRVYRLWYARLLILL